MKIYKHLVSQSSRVWYRLGSVSLLISVFSFFIDPDLLAAGAFLAASPRGTDPDPLVTNKCLKVCVLVRVAVSGIGSVVFRY